MFKKNILIAVILTLLASFPYSGTAATKTALSSGKWEQASRWSGGQLPACGDTIIISAGITVEITSILDFSGCGTRMHLNISGTLDFQTGKKLRLPCSSTIQLNSGGSITAGNGGGNSNLIDICESTVWNAAQGNLTGPLVIQLNPLPVEMAYLSVRPDKEGITISWITLSEKGNSHFTVEKSKNGKSFNDLVRVEGAGTTSQLNSYLVTDMNPFEGVQYYRIRQTDFNGASTTSKMIAINWNSAFAFQIFPNPSRGELFANIDPQLEGQTGKLIINRSDGKLHLLRDIKIEGGTYGIKLLGQKEMLKPGSYLVSLNFKDHNYSQLIISK
jgi:hypothetical protein